MTHRETTWAGAVVLCLAAVLGCQDTTPTTGSSAPQSEGGEQAAIPGDLDLVILNGRVMDPETELDAIRNVGIKDGKIVVVTEQAIEGSETIDAKGHVVAPGFIDYHMHGQDPFSVKIALRDGVTSQLDLELGAWPVDEYYDKRKDKWQANYGASVAHVSTRIMVMDDINSHGQALVTGAIESAGRKHEWSTDRSTPEQLKKIVQLVDEGLQQGGIGIGFPVGYYPGAASTEVMEVAKLAAKHGGLPITTHVRYLSQIEPSGYLGLLEFLGISETLKVPLLVHHISSNLMGLTPEGLALIDDARKSGHNVVAEAYPYMKGSSIIGAAYLGPGFQERTGMTYSDITWVETMKPETKSSFEQHRKSDPGGLMIMHHIKELDMLAAITHPGLFIGSDAMPYIDSKGGLLDWGAPVEDANGHPRAAGSHAKMLRMSREQQTMPLMEAISKMTYLPAQFLEAFVPAIKERGRIRVGAVADITIFDPATVSDKSTYQPGESALPSVGIPYVIVNGTTVVKDSKVLQGVYPGKAIRRPVN